MNLSWIFSKDMDAPINMDSLANKNATVDTNAAAFKDVSTTKTDASTANTDITTNTDTSITNTDASTSNTDITTNTYASTANTDITTNTYASTANTDITTNTYACTANTDTSTTNTDITRNISASTTDAVITASTDTFTTNTNIIANTDASTANTDASTTNTDASTANTDSPTTNTDSASTNTDAPTSNTDAPTTNTDASTTNTDVSLDIESSVNTGTSVDTNAASIMDATQACEMSSGRLGAPPEDSFQIMSPLRPPPRLNYSSWDEDAFSLTHQLPSSCESSTLEETTVHCRCPSYLENSVDEDWVSRIHQLAPSAEFSTLEGTIEPLMKPNSQLLEEHSGDSLAQSNTDPPCSISRNPKLHPEEPDTSPMAVYNKIMFNNRVTFGNIPSGVRFEQLKTLAEKMGPVFRMAKEQNMLHVIYIHQKGAEKAFNTNHWILGQNLVVIRPANKLCSLFLGGLPPGTSNRDIVKVLDNYGPIISMTRPTHPNNGLPVNYCFIFIKETAAEKILEQKYININNKMVFIEMAKNQLVEPKPDGVYKVFLKHLPDDISYLEVREYFSLFGNPVKVYVKNKRGFLYFDSEEAVQIVLGLDHTLQGKRITVTLDDVPEIQLFFGGLPPNVSNATIMEQIRKYGPVLDMFRPYDKFTGELASFFFATFEDLSTTQYLIDRGYIHIGSKEIGVRQSKRSASGGGYCTNQ